MSVDAAVDELYGDDKDNDWKAEEVSRIKSELGIAELEEPGVNTESVNMEDKPITEEGTQNESQSGQPDVRNEQGGISGITGGGKGTDTTRNIRH